MKPKHETDAVIEQLLEDAIRERGSSFDAIPRDGIVRAFKAMLQDEAFIQDAIVDPWNAENTTDVTCLDLPIGEQEQTLDKLDEYMVQHVIEYVFAYLVVA